VIVAEWLPGWTFDDAHGYGERMMRHDGEWVRTVSFGAGLLSRSTVERVALLVVRMPNVEATIEILRNDLASMYIDVEYASSGDRCEIHALAEQLPRRSMRIEIARAPSAAKPAPNELAQAIAALAEARARCDELRASNVSLTIERNTAQALHEEALRVQDAIWDAVGGQREGETLVDAVRRVVGMKQQSSERVAATKPERVEAGQWWACCYEDYGTWCPFRVARTNEIAAFGRSFRDARRDAS
jgi:hypothetical protein